MVKLLHVCRETRDDERIHYRRAAAAEGIVGDIAVHIVAVVEALHIVVAASHIADFLEEVGA